MRWNRKLVGWSVAVLAIVVYSLLPVAWITSLSFKQGDDINNQQFLPTHWSLDNYRTVFDTNLFTSALRNSLGISLIATAIAVALATVAAYAIARLEFKGKKLVLSLSLAIAMFPVVSLVGPLFDMWRALNLYD
ncbi:MAG: carbohydrate ABC transporter permease, partial [Actinomycetes bacterium]